MALNKDFKVKNGLTVTQDLSVGGNAYLNSLTGTNATFTKLTATEFVATSATFTRTIVSSTSALSVINSGTGPALYVRQKGAQPIAQFIDQEGGEIHFADTGALGVNTATPNEKLTVSGNISALGSLSAGLGSQIAACNSAAGGFISGGRDLADIFVTSAGSVDGSGTAGFGAQWSDSNTLADSLLSGGTAVTRTTGTLSAATAICSPAICGTTSVCGPAVCGTTSVCGPAVCGTTSVCSPAVCGSTSVCSPAVCGTTSVCSPAVCGTTSVCGAAVCGTTSVCGPAVCGTSTVCSPQVCGTTKVQGVAVCGTTSVCGALVCSTGSIVGDSLSAYKGLSGLHVAVCNSSYGGFLSGGRDLADIFTTCSGDVTGVTAGPGLSGGGTEGDVTLGVGFGDGITVAADTVAVDSTVVRTTGAQSIGGAKTFSSDITTSRGLTAHGGLSARSTRNGFVSAGRDLADIFETCSNSVDGSGTAGFGAQWSDTDTLTDSLLSGGTAMTRTTGSLSASTAICSPAICGTISVCGAAVCGTSTVCSPDVCGTSTVCSPAVCGTTSVCSPAVCGTTSVCGALVCSTGSIVGNSVSAYNGLSGLHFAACNSSYGGFISGGRDLADIFARSAGNITGVTAGPGLSGGGTEGDVTLGVGFGDGITVAANTVAVDSTVVRTTGDQTLAGKKTFSRGITTSDGLSATSTRNGFVSAGRDLADIFATSSGNVDGSGTAGFGAQWSDTDTLTDSLLSGGTDVTRTTGTLSAATAVCSPAICGTTSVCGAAVCGTTSVCSPAVCGTTSVCGPAICGTTSVCGPAVCGTSTVCSPQVCGTTKVQGVAVCGTTSVCSPQVCGTTKVQGVAVCGTTSVCGAAVCGTTSVCSPQVCGTTKVEGVAVCGTTSVCGPAVCGTTSVCGGTVVGTSISATSTNSGIVSAGRDLADIFATSSGNVDGSGSTGYLSYWSDSNTLTDSLLSGGTDVTRTTGTLSASTAVCSPAICGTTSVCGAAVCGTTSVCGPAVCGTTSVCGGTIVGVSLSATSTNSGIVSAGRDLVDVFAGGCCLGTVTSVAGGDGMSGTVTSSGSLAVDSTVVRTTGAESIGGLKTFTDNITTSRGLTAHDGLSARSTRNGFVSAGRDLADIFATSSGNVDGSGSTGYLSYWSDSNTLTDSLLSGGTAVTRTTGTLSAGCLIGPAVCGTTSVCSPAICGTTSVCGAAVCGTTSVCSPAVCGSTSVCSPQVCGTTKVQGVAVCGTTSVCGAAVCGTTSVRSPAVCGTTSVCGALVCSTGSIVGDSLSAYNGLSGLHVAACNSSYGGFISGGRDLVDVFAGGCCLGTVTSVTGGDGIDSTGGATPEIAVNSSVVRTTGDQTIEGNKSFTGNTSMTGNLSVRGTVTCIDTRIETTSAVEIHNSGTGPALCVNQTGAQPVADFQDDGASALYIKDGGNVGIGTNTPNVELTVAGTLSAFTAVCSPAVCGTTSVCGADVCGTTSVCSPQVCGTTKVQGVAVCGTTSVCGAAVCGTTSVCGPAVCGTTSVCGPAVCGTTSVTSPAVCGTTSVCGALVCSTGSIVGTSLSAYKGLSALHVAVCNSSYGGFLSGGRDLADIFAVSSGSVDGSGSTGYLSYWSDSNTLTDSLLSGGTAVTRTTGTLSAATAVCSPQVCGTTKVQGVAVCGTTSVCGAAVCGTTSVCSPQVCGTTKVQGVDVCGTSSVCGAVVCGTTSVTSPAVCGTTSIGGPAVCGSTSVCSPAVCGTTSVCSPQVCGTTKVQGVAVCGTTSVCGAAVCGTTSVCGPAVCGTTSVCGPAVCGSTSVCSPAVCGTTSVCGPAVCGTTSVCGGTIVGVSLSATSTNSGFVSAGRDLADIFATSSGNVDGSGTAGFGAQWSDSNTLTDSLLSGGTAVTRTTGTLSAATAVCSPAICGTTSVCGAAVCGTTSVCGAAVCGTTSVCSPQVCGTTKVQGVAVCGTTSVCGPAVCGTTSVCSPQVCGTTKVQGVAVCGTTSVCGAAVCGTTSVCGGTVVGTSISATSTTNGFVSAGRNLVDVFAGGCCLGTVTSVTGGDGIDSTGGATPEIAVNSSVVRTTGDQTIAGKKTFSRGITTSDGLSAAATTNGFVSAGRDLADIFATSAGNVDGSGTAGFGTQWSDTDTLTDSLLSGGTAMTRTTGSLSATTDIYVGGDVGIGTLAPSFALEIDGSTGCASDNALKVKSGHSATGKAVHIQTNNGSTEALAILGSGNVGIGTSAPEERLSVTGNVSATGTITAEDGVIDDYLQVGRLTVNGPGLGSNDFRVEGTSTQYLIFADANENKVGIGTSAPDSRLGVGGDITASGNISALGSLSAGPGSQIAACNSAAGGFISGGRDLADIFATSSGSVDGSGSTGYLSYWTDSNTLADSLLSGGSAVTRTTGTLSAGCLIGPAVCGTTSVCGAAVCGTTSVCGPAVCGSTSVCSPQVCGTTKVQGVAVCGTTSVCGAAVCGTTSVCGALVCSTGSIVGNSVSAYNGLSGLHVAACNSSYGGFISGGRDLVDVFAGGCCLGTVTSVTGGDGMSGTVTSSGSLAVDSTVVRTTGDQTIAGNKSFTGNTSMTGNLSVRGTVTCIDTRIETTSAVEIHNSGTGPALCVNQTGAQPVADFQDDGTSALYIKDGGNVGIGTNDPNVELTVAGTLSAFTAVCSPAVCGYTSVCGADVCGKTSVTSPAVCGTTSVCGALVCGTTSIQSPSICGTTKVQGGDLVATGPVCGATVCGTTSIQSPAVCGTTSVCGALVCSTGSIVGNSVSAYNGLSGLHFAACNSSYGGFISGGRDLADIFAVSSGSVDGSGTANFLPSWSDSNTLADSLLSGGTAVTRTTGSLSATTDIYVGGCLGIGTVTPNEALTVSGNISASGTTYSDQFQTPNASGCGYWVTGNTVHSGMYNGGGLAVLSFKSNGSRLLQLCNNTSQKRVQLESDGELGFSTDLTLTRPAANTLAVGGSISALGSLSAGLGEHVAVCNSSYGGFISGGRDLADIFATSSGNVDGSGSTGYLSYWSDTDTLANSLLSGGTAMTRTTGSLSAATAVCSPAVCGTTSVCSPAVCGTTSVCSPQVCGTTKVQGVAVCGTTSVCGAAVCGTTSVCSPAVCGTTSVCGALVCSTGSIVGTSLSAYKGLSGLHVAACNSSYGGFISGGRDLADVFTGGCCLGTTTASNTQTFTNKSGNISQWTNDSGYTDCLGTVTSVGTGDGLDGGAITGSGTLTVDSTVVRTTGDQTIAGNKSFTGNTSMTGNLSVRGTVTCIDTRIETTSAVEIHNSGTGPALCVNQTGAQPVADFQDDSTSALYIANGGNVGIGTNTPNEELTVAGTLSACTSVYSPAICGTTSVCGVNVVGTTLVCGATVCGPQVCGTTKVQGVAVCGTTSVCGPAVCGTTSVCSPQVCGTTKVQGVAVCGTTSVCGPAVCGTTSVCGPAVCGSTSVCSPAVCGTTSVCSPAVCGTTSVCGAAVCGTTSVCSPQVCGSTKVQGVAVCGTTSVCGGTVYGTTLSASNGLSATGAANYFSGKVGIGTATPSAKLHVKESAAGSFAFDGSADTLVVESNANGGITIATAAANTGRLIFASPNDATGAELKYSDATSLMTLGTITPGDSLVFQSGNGVEAARIDSSGNVGIGTTAPSEKLTVSGNISALGSLSAGLGEHVAVCNSSSGGFLSGGRDLADIFATSSGNVDGSGNTGYLSYWSDTDTLANSLLSGGTDVTRTTGTLSAATAVCSPAICGTTSVCGAAVCGTSTVCSPQVCGTTKVQGVAVCGTTSVCGAAVCGTTSVCSPQVCGTTKVQGVDVCGTSSVCGAVVCGTTSVTSPAVCGTTSIGGPAVCGSTSVCSPAVCGTTSVCGPQVCGTTKVQGPAVCGTTSVCGAAVCGTTSVCGALVCSTGSIVGTSLSAYKGLSGLHVAACNSSYGGFISGGRDLADVFTGGCCLGTTTASNSQTFTNKSGNISQWTNDSGYTDCLGTVTSVGTGDGLDGGAITGSGTLTVDSTVVRTTGNQTIAGNKSFTGNTSMTGNLSVRGTVTCIDTRIETTSAVEIHNSGTGPALCVNQTGAQPVADFQDDSTTALYIANGGNVGIGTNTPNVELTVAGTLSACTSVYSNDICGIATVCGAAVCGTTSVRSPAVCGSTSVCGAAVCGTTSVRSPAVCGSTSVCGAAVCGTTSVCSPQVCGSTKVQGPAVCGTTSVCGPAVCGSTSVCSPAVCGTTSVCGPQVCGTTKVQGVAVCGTTSVCGAAVCGTTSVTSPAVCGTTSVCGALVCSTGSIVGTSLSAYKGLSGLHVAVCNSSYGGFLSGGRDLADIFATSSGNVDGSGSTGYLSYWSDSNTLTDSLLSGGTAVTRTTGTLSAATAVCSPAICGTTSVCGAAVCGTSTVCSPQVCGTTKVQGVAVCGTTSVCGAAVCGTTSVCSPAVCGTTSVCGAAVCGTTSVCSPQVCGTTKVQGVAVCGTTSVCGPAVCGTTSVCSPAVCGTTSVCSPQVCGTTKVQGVAVCGTTSVCGPAVCGTTSVCGGTVVGTSISATSTNSGFVSAGRDLADIFATSTGNVDGSGTAGFGAQWSDSNTLADSLLSGGTAMTRTTGSLSATTDIYVGGDVGIGTLAPSEALDVVGNASVSGGITTGGQLMYASDINLPTNKGIRIGNNMFYSGSGTTADIANTVFVGRDGGNVGIGTSAPNVELTVSGDLSASGNGYFACVVAGGYFEQKVANSTLAEYPTGSVVVIGDNGELELSKKSYDTRVFGVTKHGVCQPIVLGAEPVLVTGDIAVGDFITTSDKPGHGKKSSQTTHGSVIAQAMESGKGCSFTLKAMIRKM